MTTIILFILVSILAVALIALLKLIDYLVDQIFDSNKKGDYFTRNMYIGLLIFVLVCYILIFIV